jgi:hypothetical protein
MPVHVFVCLLGFPPVGVQNSNHPIRLDDGIFLDIPERYAAQRRCMQHSFRPPERHIYAAEMWAKSRGCEDSGDRVSGECDCLYASMWFKTCVGVAGTSRTGSYPTRRSIWWMRRRQACACRLRASPRCWMSWTGASCSWIWNGFRSLNPAVRLSALISPETRRHWYFFFFFFCVQSVD